MFFSRKIVPSLLLLLAVSAFSFSVPSVGSNRAAFVAKQPTRLFLSDVSTTSVEAVSKAAD
jgi:hypothetical protein